MRQRVSILVLALAVVAGVLLSGCGGNPRAVELLARADSLMNGRTDSALTVLDSLLADADHLSRRQEMRCRLLRMNAINKLDTVFNAVHVSQALALADYFNRCGTSNEQMLAYYLLGRTYIDTGDAPEALRSYQEAINSADTLSVDCDYSTLCRVYTQMAYVLYYQHLFSDELVSLNMAKHYGYLAKDTLAALLAYAQEMDTYEMMLKPDSMLYICETSSKLLKEIGKTETAAGMLFTPVCFLLDCGNIAKARLFLETYEHESGFFDANNNIETGREIYYYAKGYYYLKTCQYDSAEYFFLRNLLQEKTLTTRMLDRMVWHCCSSRLISPTQRPSMRSIAMR